MIIILLLGFASVHDTANYKRQEEIVLGSFSCGKRVNTNYTLSLKQTSRLLKLILPMTGSSPVDLAVIEPLD